MSNYLIHSAKGTSWKDHKYIRKVGDRYYYVTKKESSKIDVNRQLAEDSKKRYLEESKKEAAAVAKSKERPSDKQYHDNAINEAKKYNKNSKDRVSAYNYYTKTANELETKHDVTASVKMVNDIKTKANKTYEAGKNAVYSILAIGKAFKKK